MIKDHTLTNAIECLASAIFRLNTAVKSHPRDCECSRLCRARRLIFQAHEELRQALIENRQQRNQPQKE
jgi:hypothetical protein